MEKYEVSKQFLLDGHSDACQEWKERIEKEVPELFKKNLEVGKWYKDLDGRVFFVEKWEDKMNKKAKGYGFVDNSWVETPIDGIFNYCFISRDPIEATKEEVESTLIAEAKKRGYDKAYAVNCLLPVGSDRIVINSKITFTFYCGSLWIKHDGEAICIFRRGKWAEIIEQPKDDDKQTLRNQVAELSKQVEKLKKQIG